MTDRVPISLIIDDSCPVLHLHRTHAENVNESILTEEGNLLRETVPNDFLKRFCDLVEARGFAGKFSIIPSPGGRGDVARGIAGFDPALTREWLDIVQNRLSDRFDFSPEGLTHSLAIDLATGKPLQCEWIWVNTQDRTTLTPYLTHQLELLKSVGIKATGFTSPWDFGIHVEDEYIQAMIAAQKQVNDADFSWYFLHCCGSKPGTKPWVAYRQGPVAIVSIPTTLDDHCWATIHSTRTDREFINGITDRFLTGDGGGGAIIEVLQAGGWPILLAHWQSLFSNGLETGLHILDEVGRRIQEHLSDRVVWMNLSEIAKETFWTRMN